MLKNLNNGVRSGIKSINSINEAIIQKTTELEESILKQMAVANKVRFRRGVGLFAILFGTSFIFRDDINRYLGRQVSEVAQISMEDHKLKNNLKVYLEAMLTDEGLKNQTQAVLTDVVKRTLADPSVIKAGEDYLIATFTSESVTNQLNQNVVDITNNQDVQSQASIALNKVIKSSVYNIFTFKSQ